MLCDIFLITTGYNGDRNTFCLPADAFNKA